MFRAPEPRMFMRGGQFFLRRGDFPFRPGYAKKPDLARVVGRSVLALCIRELWSLFAGGFN
eukprot:11213201-Lingulodinium_polyedra.AAC.1